jgi:hypothetical protein
MRFAAHFGLILEIESLNTLESVLEGNFLVSIRKNGARNGTLPH